MNEQTVLHRADDVTFQVVDGQAILLDLNAGHYFSLNKVGTAFWLQLDGRTTLASHAGALAHRYGVPYERVLADLTSLAQDLTDKGIAQQSDH